jgi:hypothetical protein
MGMSVEEVSYWERLGLEPTIAFELSDGRIGFCHRREEREVAGTKYVRFVAATVFEREGVQAYSVFEVPPHLVVREEPFNPRKSATFGDFLRTLKEGLFGGGERR